QRVGPLEAGAPGDEHQPAGQRARGEDGPGQDASHLPLPVEPLGDPYREPASGNGSGGSLPCCSAVRGWAGVGSLTRPSMTGGIWLHAVDRTAGMLAGVVCLSNRQMITIGGWLRSLRSARASSVPEDAL